MIKKVLKKGFSALGYTLQKKSSTASALPKQGPLTMQGAINRCCKRGLNVNTVIDVGASDGRWSVDCMKYLPTANYFLVEAQAGHTEGLNRFKDDHPKGDYVLAAAGNSEGKIYFDEGDLFGGVASETPLAKNCIEVPVVILDNEIKKRNLEPPFLLKLDTHGFELPILEGAREIINKAELIIIETYNFQLTENSLRYWEMCAYMEKLGFLPIENVDLKIRTRDKAFWQMDTFFIPKDNDSFSHRTYS